MKVDLDKKSTIYLFFGNVLNDFVPDGLEPSSMLIRDGELWICNNFSDELGFIVLDI